jgi:hypothetical protein
MTGTAIALRPSRMPTWSPGAAVVVAIVVTLPATLLIGAN